MDDSPQTPNIPKQKSYNLNEPDMDDTTQIKKTYKLKLKHYTKANQNLTRKL